MGPPPDELLPPRGRHDRRTPPRRDGRRIVDVRCSASCGKSPTRSSPPNLKSARSSWSRASSRWPAGAADGCLSPIRRIPPPRIEGFLIALPMDGGRRWSFEMYRHRPDAVRGVVPHLFHEIMIRMKAEGIDSVSLCLRPRAGLRRGPAGRQRPHSPLAVLRQEASQFPVRLCRTLPFQEPLPAALRKPLRLFAARIVGTGNARPVPDERIVDLRSEERSAKHFARNLFKRRERQQLADRNGSLAMACQGGE